MKRTYVSLLVVISVFVFGFSSSASAEIIQYQFSGTITKITEWDPTLRWIRSMDLPDNPLEYKGSFSIDTESYPWGPDSASVVDYYVDIGPYRISIDDETAISATGEDDSGQCLYIYETPLPPFPYDYSWAEIGITFCGITVNDLREGTADSISGFSGGNIWFFTVKDEAIDGNILDFEGDVMDSLTVVEDTIPLPSANAYGNIKGGDQSHIDEVKYSFGGMAGGVILNFEAWDVDFTDEIEIILNGTRIGYAPKTANDSWGGAQTITLPDASVNDSSDNYLTFNNTSNPPNQWYWGVRNVSVD